MSLKIAGQGAVLKEPRHVVAGLRVLVLLALSMLGLGHPPVHPVLYWSLTILYGAVVLGYLHTKNIALNTAHVQALVFLFDVIAVSLLIILRGGDVSGVLMAYFALVLIAAVIDGLGNSLFNALLVACIYTAITKWGQPAESLLSFGFMGQLVFFLVIAILMGHVAAEARREAAIRRQMEVDKKRIQSQLRNASSNLRQSTLQLKKAQESLRANERLATLGMLSAGIAHEMKNPIAAIHANVEVGPSLLEELHEAYVGGSDPSEAEAELRDILGDCEHACSHLQKIVVDLNDMVRGRAAMVQSIQPLDSLKGAMRMLRKKAGPSVEITIASRATRNVHADHGRLLQVLVNLAGNAIDALHEQDGGVLALSAEDAGEDRVAFLVEDDGPGIPPEVRDKMFEPFMTTKSPGKGTGLGLHLVNEIVKSHHGTIVVESTQGVGTCFRVELPAGIRTEAKETEDGATEEDRAVGGRSGVHPQSAPAKLAG